MLGELLSCGSTHPEPFGALEFREREPPDAARGSLIPSRASVRGLRLPVTTMFSDFWNARNALRVDSPRIPLGAPAL